MVNLISLISTFSRARRLFLVTFLVLGIPLSVSGQAPVLEISGEASGEYSIILTPVVTIGDSVGPGMIGGISTITKLADGRYALSAEGEDDLVKVFSADGRFLQSAGGRGHGPGEFVYIRFLLTSGDNLHVFNLAPYRQTVFSSDFSVIRTNRYQIMNPWDAVVIGDSLAVINATVRKSDQMSSLLHVIDRNGNTILSFAEVPGRYSPEVRGSVFYRELARSSTGGIWALHRMQYQIEEWSIEGTLLRTIVRRIPWFPENPAERNGSMRDSEGRRLPGNLWPTGQDVREDDIDRLWVAVRVPDVEWPDAVTISGSAEGERVVIHDSQRARDTVIEVIDLQTGTVLASTRFDQSLYKFIGNDEIISGSYEEDGSYRVHVWRLSLQYPPPLDH